MNPMQQAFFLQSKFGDFGVGSQAIPQPGFGELLVKVQSAALNPIDWKVQKYGIVHEQFPAILGVAAAGVVEDVGEGVTSFAKQDRVFYPSTFTNATASFQQYNIAIADTASKIPTEMSFDEAATIPNGLGTALFGLYTAKPHGAGFVAPIEIASRGRNANQPILILGGSGSVGQYVIQLAKLSGFSPIITTSALSNKAYLESLGATHVLDRHLSPTALDTEIQKITSEPIKIAFDAVSTETTQASGYKVLSPGGALVILLSPTVHTKGEIEVIQASGDISLPEYQEIGRRLYASVAELLEEGVIKPNKFEVVPGGLEGIHAGLERLQTRTNAGGRKLVVHPQESV